MSGNINLFLEIDGSKLPIITRQKFEWLIIKDQPNIFISETQNHRTMQLKAWHAGSWDLTSKPGRGQHGTGSRTVLNVHAVAIKHYKHYTSENKSAPVNVKHWSNIL